MEKNSNNKKFRVFLFSLLFISVFLFVPGPALSLESPSCGEGKCDPWQVPDPQDPQSCLCWGECIGEPKNPRYYDNPTYSDRPNRNLGPNGFDGQGLKLPVKLDWDDVPGFKENALRTMSLAELLEKLPGPVKTRLTIQEILGQIPEEILKSVSATEIVMKLPFNFLDPFSPSFPEKFINQLSIDILNQIPEQDLLQAINALAQKLPPWDINKIPTEIFRGLPPKIIDSLPLKVLERMPPEFLEQTVAVRNLNQLSSGILQQFSIDTLKHLSVQSLNKLPISFLRQLPQNHLKQLPLDFVAQLSGSVLEQMPVDYLKDLSPYILKKLSPEALEKLPVKTLKAFKTEITGPLTMEEFNQIPSEVFEKTPELLELPLNFLLQLKNSNQGDLSSIDRQKIVNYLTRNVPQNELPQLPLYVLNLLPKDFIEKLPTSLLQQLPIDFLKNRDSGILSKLTADFLSIIPLQSLAQLPPEFIVLLPKDILNRLPLKYFKSLSKNTLQKLPPDFLNTLPADVLEQLPEEFIMKIPPSFLANLPSKILESLPQDFLMTLSPVILADLPFEALNDLPFDFLNQMPTGLLGNLPWGIVDYLTTLPDDLNWRFLRVAGSDRKECPEIYIIRIENLKGQEYRQALTKSEFIPPPSCFFEPDTTYRWHVKACCGRDEGQCGKESTWTFTTSDAPELKWPLDPDWSGQNSKDNQKPDSVLEWCQQKIEPTEILPWPRSIKLLFYVLENNKEVCHPGLLNQQGLCEPLLILPANELPMPEERNIQYPLPKFPTRDYQTQLFTDFFSKNNIYSWQVSVCKDPQAQDCTVWSQKWKFIPRFIINSLDFSPNLPDDPWGEKPVGLPLTLAWEKKSGVNSVVWEIQGTNISDQGIFPLQRPVYDYPQLSLNAIYSWRVKPCWDYEGKECEDFLERYWYFKTTGQPPAKSSLYPQADNIPIPVVFGWENVGGAQSYVLKVQGPDWEITKTILAGQSFSLDYPDLIQETQYSWQIKTCADPRGEICGEWSPETQFITFRLPKPQTPSPQDKEEIFLPQFPRVFSWQAVPFAKYYKYSVTYTERALGESQECQLGTVTGKIVNRPSDLVSLGCAGEYQWQAAGCLDENCLEQGKVSQWSFTLSPEIKEAGFKSCGLRFNDPKTPWDERESCQTKNIFITIKIIFDFILLTIIPLALLLLAIDSGIIFYSKKQRPDNLGKIKIIWLKTTKWLAIVLLVWALITMILPVLGYPIGFYSPWP